MTTSTAEPWEPIIRKVVGRRRLLFVAGTVTLGTVVALTSCTGGSSGPSPSPSQPPVAGSSGPVELTRQQTIAKGRDLTLRVEVTRCTGYATGSGFLVGPRLVATSAHVVKSAQTVAVRGLTDGAAGVVIGIDRQRDVALIRTSADVGVGDPLVFAEEEPEPGDEVVVIGYPKGRPQTPTNGTVNRLGQSVDIDKRRLNDLVQFDADVSPGSSGGPLLDLQGKVIGMTEGQYQDAAGLNYAVSSKTAHPLVDAWAKSPAEADPAHCPSRRTSVGDRSESADGPGITFFLRQYFDSLNAAVAQQDDDPYASLGHYNDAFDTLSGRLLKELGPFKRFRSERLDVRHSTVRVLGVRRVNEVTDSAEVTFMRTLPGTRTGKKICYLYHYRYQMRLASGKWTLDDRKELSDNRSRC